MPRNVDCLCASSARDGLVQVTGFEPVASCSRSRRSAKLSYTRVMVVEAGVEPAASAL